MINTKNIIISGTNFWNPGDDFVRDGVITILKELFPSDILNFHFYNFNADFFPHTKFSGISNTVQAGDLEQYKNHVDYIVIAGLSAGVEIKDLYNWILKNNLQDRVYLIGAGYENDYVDKYISQEPEATIFRNAKVITSRTFKRPAFVNNNNLNFHYINCPAILSVPEVKNVSKNKKIERIGFSIQLPNGIGILNQLCSPENYKLALDILLGLSKNYEVEVVAHHKSEYFYFLELLKNHNIPVIYSSYYQDLFNLYPRYDLVITTRLHSSLFANGFGIPGIIINNTDRHTHCLQGFPHSVWVNSMAGFEKEFRSVLGKDLQKISEEAHSFKKDLLGKYINVLSKPFGLSWHENNRGNLSRKMNLGCGFDYREGYINVDGNAQLPKVDYVLDIKPGTLRKVFNPGFLEEIVAKDFVEHHFHWEARQLLEDFFSILGNNGRLDITLPDIELILDDNSKPLKERLMWLYGGQDIGTPQDTEDHKAMRQKYASYFCHKFGWTKETITNELKSVGFNKVNIEVQGWNMHVIAVKEIQPEIEKPQSVKVQANIIPVFDSEKKEQLLVRNHVGEGMTVFDIGANIGKYTRLFSHLVGEKGRVFAFEPSSFAFDKIAEDKKNENLQNVHLFKNAVYSENTKITLNEFPEEFCSWNSIGKPVMQKPKTHDEYVPIVNSVEVEAVSLDDFCQKNKIKTIDYLKLDVEGAEIFALKGAQKLLQKKAIKFLQFEISKQMLEGLNTSAKAVFDFLNENGYSTYAITENGEFGKKASDSTEFYENYIAIPKKEVQRDIPVHFFTIVLNGQPFIERQIEILNKLPFKWHWHIIEGVADLKHDTAWSLQNGAKINEAMHKNGLSIDGTSQYLDKLFQDFPDNVSLYRKENAFWDGKLEMVNAPLSHIKEEALLWQLDVDEFWLPWQIGKMREMFIQDADKSAAMFYCHFFVGENRITGTKNTYGNNSGYEWLRVWRFHPSDYFDSHEPPKLMHQSDTGQVFDKGTYDVFTHKMTENEGLVFEHYAYFLERQLRFKEDYYGYKDAVQHWLKLQDVKEFPVLLQNYFPWVKDIAKVITTQQAGLTPLLQKAAKNSWQINTAKLKNNKADYNPLSYLDSDDEKTVLWLRADSIGDAILSMEVLTKFSIRYKNVKNIVVCQEHIKELYEAHPDVAEVISFDKKKLIADTQYQQQLVQVLRNKKAFLSINAVYSRDLVSDFLTLNSDAMRSVAFEGDNSNIEEKLRLDHNKIYNFLVPVSGDDKKETQRNAALLNFLTGKISEVNPQIFIDKNDEEFAADFYKKNNLDPEKTLVLFAGAQHAIKHYDNFGAALSQICAENGFSVIALGSKSEYDLNQRNLDSIRNNTINLSGQTTILQAAALIKKCKMVVGSDTSMGHMAAAFNVPQVIVLGGGHFGRFMPVHHSTAVVSLPMACFGCNWQCIYDRVKCIQDVSVSHLKFAIEQQLNKQGKRAHLYIQQEKENPNSLLNIQKFINPDDVEIVYVDAPGDTHTSGLSEQTQNNNSDISEYSQIPPTELNDNKSQTVYKDDRNRDDYIVSAIVSTYASERFIEGCLQSLVNQTLFKQGRLEIIVIDANSPQNEKAIVEKFSEKYNHIVYYKTEKRETIYEAWNRGIKMARGKYITNSNTDDRLATDGIERLVNLLEANPDKACAYGNSLVTKQSNETFENNSADDSLDWPEFDRNTMHTWCYIGPQPLWKKTLHDEIGYFDTSFKSAADWDFWLRAALKYDFIHLDEYVGLFYYSEDSVSRSGDLPIVEAHQVRRKHKTAYQQVVDEIILPPKMNYSREGTKNLLICVHNFPPFWYSGTENYVFQLAKLMMDKGWNVHVFFPHIDINHAAPELRVQIFEGIQTFQLWHDGHDFISQLDFGGEKHIKIFKALLENNHYDLVHFQHVMGFPLEFFDVVKNKNIPYGLTLHDFTMACFRSHLFRYENWELCSGPEALKCAKCFFDLAQATPTENQLDGVKLAVANRLKTGGSFIKEAEFVTAPSKYVAELFTKFGLDPNKKIEVVPLGLPGIHTSNIKGINSGEEIVFAFLGTVTLLKNVPFMLDAFSSVKGNMRMEVWGSGDATLIEKVNAQCAIDSRIVYKGGYTPKDIPNILASVDMVVIPSIIESYSFVVRESFMSGKPVIASAVGGILEIVEDGRNGLLFNPTKKDELIACFQKVITQKDLITELTSNIQPVRNINDDMDTYEQKYLAIIENNKSSVLPEDHSRLKDSGRKTNLTSTIAETSRTHSSENNSAIRNTDPRDKQENVPLKPMITFLALEEHVFACPQIRLDGPLSVLNEKGKVNYLKMDFVAEKNSEIDVKALMDCDTVIVQRNLAREIPYSRLRAALNNDSIKIVFEFDDAFDRLPTGHPAYGYYQQMKSNFEDYIRNADLVTVSTEKLKEYYGHLSNKIVVLPNTLNKETWKQVTCPVKKDTKIRLLFAGTIGHEPDLAIIEEDLKRILTENPDKVELLLWGNINPELQKLQNVIEVEQFKTRYPEYADILKKMHVDIALVPLMENPFNDAKSHIKWLEYSACGIPGIYSDVPAYNKYVINKKTGLLVKSHPGNWYKAIKQLIENPKMRKTIRRAAQKEVWEKHTIENHIHLWEEAYTNLFTTKKSIDVSVIIPVFNKVEYTQKCINSILKNTEANYEIIVVDNASTDETAQYLEKISSEEAHVKYLRNRVNAGFAGANNQAAEIACGKYLVFLNNDTEALPGWLGKMLKVAEADKTVGAVGNKLLYPDLTIQHGGVVIIDNQNSGDPLLAQNIFVGQNSDFKDANQMREYQAVTAACMLVSKSKYQQVDGFDEEFWNGYEDVDLCFKLREAGYKIIYQPESEVIHFESKSGQERFAKVSQNIALLHKKWLGKIKPDFILDKSGNVNQSEPVQIKPYPSARGKQEKSTEQSISGLVSIVMLTCNALDYTKRCVKSIQAHTHYPHEIIFVDNASQDGTQDYLRKLVKKNPGYQVIENKNNAGFAAGNNQAVKIARGEYVLFLNNDVLVSENWLNDMVSGFAKDEKIGMIGPLTNSISGLQMLDNVPYKDDKEFASFAVQIRKENGGRFTPRRRIAGFAVLMPKKLYKEVKGFDESFGIGNFEDDDLCLKVREKGYAIMVHEGTFIHHFGSQSFKANNINILQSLDEKGKVFKQKWPDVDYDELLEMKNPLHKVHPEIIKNATELLENNQRDDAFNLFGQVLTENPLSAEALFGIALIYQMENDYDSARESLEKAVSLFPENPALLNQLGIIAFRSNDLEGAQTYFARAITKDPEFIDAKRNYGQVLIDSGDYENGVLAFTKILEKNPDDIISLLYMAGLFMEIENFEKALSYLEKVIEMDPQNEDALQKMREITSAKLAAENSKEEDPLLDEAVRHFESFEIDDAEKLFQQSYANHQNADALFGIALCSFRKEQDIKTIKTLNKLLEQWPDYAPAYNQLGMLYFKNGDYTSATSFFARAIEKDNTYLEAQRNYGLSLIEEEDYQNGISVFQKILDSHPDDAETLMIMANFHIELEKWQEAEQLVNKILQSSPDDEDASKLLQLIHANLELTENS